MEAGVGTVEKLGAMTPEQLEEIPGHRAEDGGAASSRRSTRYYSQFEEPALAAAEAALPAAEPASEDMRAERRSWRIRGVGRRSWRWSRARQRNPVEAVPEASRRTLYDPEAPEERFEPESALAEADAADHGGV